MLVSWSVSVSLSCCPLPSPSVPLRFAPPSLPLLLPLSLHRSLSPLPLSVPTPPLASRPGVPGSYTHSSLAGTHRRRLVHSLRRHPGPLSAGPNPTPAPCPSQQVDRLEVIYVVTSPTASPTGLYPSTLIRPPNAVLPSPREPGPSSYTFPGHDPLLSLPSGRWDRREPATSSVCVPERDGRVPRLHESRLPYPRPRRRGCVRPSRGRQTRPSDWSPSGVCLTPLQPLPQGRRGRADGPWTD